MLFQSTQLQLLQITLMEVEIKMKLESVTLEEMSFIKDLGKRNNLHLLLLPTYRRQDSKCQECHFLVCTDQLGKRNSLSSFIHLNQTNVKERSSSSIFIPCVKGYPLYLSCFIYKVTSPCQLPLEYLRVGRSQSYVYQDKRNILTFMYNL